MSDPVLDQLASIARQAEPPLLHPEDEDRMILEAVRQRKRSRSKWRAPLAFAAAALVVLGAGLGWWMSLGGPQTASLRANLPTGDAIVATAGANFDVESMSETDRRVEVSDGTVLFDVVPLREGESFEVITPDVVVRVRGTVFSVEHGSQTVVRVYEGQVEVEERRTHARASLPAGRMWEDHAVGSLRGGPLEAEGQAAARQRHRLAAQATEPEALPTESLAAAEPVGEPEVQPAAPSTIEEPATPSAPSRPTTASRRAPAPAPTQADVARWLVEGRYDDAISTARREGWALLEADALRASGRYAEAADRYDAVGGAHGAYSAASIRFHQLSNPAEALESLDSAPDASHLGERVLGLRARLLVRLDRRQEAKSVAALYLERHAEGGLADWMRNLLDS